MERSGTRGEISLEVNRGSLSGRFLGYSLREFGLRRPLEMTYRGNAPLEMASIGNVVSIALIASDISILSRETLTLPIYPTLSTRADSGGTPIALTASDISILARANADVTNALDVKYAT